jgi:selenocysteine lyase/cysteine desulfurase
VIDAIAGYLRESNANLGGAFAASRRSDELVGQAHATAASFLGCRAEETIFGQNMTTLNFALTRALGRTLGAGDHILVTGLDHDGNVAPWLELARDLDLRVDFVGIRASSPFRWPRTRSARRPTRSASSSSLTEPEPSRGRTPCITHPTRRST